MTHMLFTLLQAGYYAEPASGAAHYSAATMGMFVLIIVIGIAGYAVQARLQSVFQQIFEGTVPRRPHGRRGGREDAPRQQHP